MRAVVVGAVAVGIGLVMVGALHAWSGPLRSLGYLPIVYGTVHVVDGCVRLVRRR